MANIERFDLKTSAEVKPKNNLTDKPKAQVLSKEPSKLSNWDANIAPILDTYPELKESINFKTSLPMMRAYNGRYNKAMSELKTDDPKAYAVFKKFTDNSYAMANELKKYGTSNFNPELELKYRKNAMAYFDDLQDLYSEDKKKGFVMNDKAQFLNSKQYEKYKQEPDVDKESSNTAKAIRKGYEDLVADYETPFVSKAYLKLKGQDTYFREKGIDLMQPITTSWGATSLQRLGEKSTSAQTNEDSYNLITSILGHVGKYKTTLDPQLAQKDQYTANDILKKIKGKSLEEKYKILKDNSKIINGITKRMGYYGNAKVIDQFKKSSIATDLNFYPASNTGKSQQDYFNMIQDGGVIDNHRRAFRNFKEADSNIRKDVLQDAQLDWKEIRDGVDLGGDLNKNDMDNMFQSLVDSQGNIRSFDAWRNELTNKLTTTLVLTDAYGFKNKYVDNTKGQIKLYNKIKGLTDPDYFVSDYNTRGNLYSQSPGDQKELRADMAKDRERQSSADLKQKQVWIDAYKKLKLAYKKKFDEANVKNVYDTTLMDIGFGDERNQALTFKGVNLSVNKDMKLKDTSGPKQENINKIFNLMFDGNGNVDTEDITLFDNADVKSGLNAIQKDDLKYKKDNNEHTLKEFLKDNNDHISVTMFRNTNVAGQVAYKFYNPDTKKSMVMFVPAKMVGSNGVKEDLYTKTGRDPLDFTFQLRGSLTMPIFKNDNGKAAYASAELKYDRENDEYYGETVIYDSTGNKTPIRTTIPYGSQISLSEAQRMYMNILKAQRNSF